MIAIGTDENDSLAGEEAENFLDGGFGDDTLVGGGAADVLRGGDDYPTSGEFFETGAGHDSLLGGAGDDSLDGGYGNDTLLGGDGNDFLDGGDSDYLDNDLYAGLELATADSLAGGAGDDTYVVDSAGDAVVENAGEGTDEVRSAVSFTLSPNVENLVLLGAGALDATGNDLANVITGNEAANRLDGGAGIDTLIGDAGDDTYVVNVAGDLVTEAEGEGTDTIRTALGTYSLESRANVENLQYAGSLSFTGTGNSLANVLTGGSGGDSLDGGAGVDTLAGDAGDDTYVVDVAGDVVTEAAGGGTDTVRTALSAYSLAGLANVENVQYAGSVSFTGTGNSLANRLSAGAGGDSLDGGAGADTLAGAAGDDTYVVDASGDVVIEAAGGGTDTVRTALDAYSLAVLANVENLRYTGASSFTAAGNSLANMLFGGQGGDRLDGGAGVDTLAGDSGDDTYVVDVAGDVVTETAGGGTDTIRTALGAYSLVSLGNVENLQYAGGLSFTGTGNSLSNQLDGGAGADLLDGGEGADTLAGGAGNDTYAVDQNGDWLVEHADGGTDLAKSAAVRFVLPDFVEELQLMGSAAISGEGNVSANKISGSVAANTLRGGGGDDTLLGGAGNDTLAVGAGESLVEGGDGVDLLQIEWAGFAGGVFGRNIQKFGTGTDATYKGNYTARDGLGRVLARVDFEGIEGLALNGVAVDLEAASAPGVLLDRLTASARTSETGEEVGYGVSLTVEPKENVTLRFQSSDLSEARLLNPELTFTPANWDKPQKLTVRGVDDFENDGDIACTISGQVVTKDLSYSRIRVPSFALINRDDTLDAALKLEGDKGVDYLQGNNGSDRIYGYNGQDQLKGGRGNDRLYGQEDDDRLYGELGDDELYGGYDDDTLDGGEGQDSLYGEQGADTLIGGAGRDYLDGGIGADWMSGGAGNDTYLVDSSGDVVNDLGASSDVDSVLVIQSIRYTLPANVENASINAVGDANLTGNTLNNVLTGNMGRNVLDGGTGNDKLDGGLGADSLVGGAGDDALIGGMGNDTMRGGAGVDLADFAAAGVDLSVDLSTGRARGEGADWLFEVENINAGEGDDNLGGSAPANALNGGAGDDSLCGWAGNDTLAGCFYGKNGGRYERDTLAGGAGDDLFELGWAGGRFYDDGDAKNSGRADYALITDFAVGRDRLQLDGSAGGYYLAAGGVAGVAGTGLYAELGATDELIAIIRSADGTALTAANTISPAVFV